MILHNKSVSFICSIDQYLKLNSPTHDKIFLITVEFNNTLFVIKELHKIHKLNTSFNKLSEFLNEKIVVYLLNNKIIVNYFNLWKTIFSQYQY